MLIIIDFDGTIGDTQKLILSTMQKTIAALHLPSRTYSECQKMIGLPLKQTFTHLIDMNDEMGDLCVQTYHRIFEEDNVPGAVPIFPNVISTLQQLHDQGHVLTIASSRSKMSLLGFVQDLNLTSYISLVISCEDVTQAKPHPEMVEKTLKATGFQPQETIVVGDAKYDIIMGRNAGCKTVGVSYGNGGYQEMKDAQADFIISDFSELTTILAELSQNTASPQST